MFNGTCNGVDHRHESIKERYRGLCWTSAWGDYGAYDIFKTIDNLNPDEEIGYETWQKLIYAGKLLAKHYNWFEHLDSANEKFCRPEVRWDPDTEEYEDKTKMIGRDMIWNPYAKKYEKQTSDSFMFENMSKYIRDEVVCSEDYRMKIKRSAVVIYSGRELNCFDTGNVLDGVQHSKGLYENVIFKDIKYKCWVDHTRLCSFPYTDIYTIVYAEPDDGKLEKSINFQTPENPILPDFLIDSKKDEINVKIKKDKNIDLANKITEYCKQAGSNINTNEIYKIIENG